MPHYEGDKHSIFFSPRTAVVLAVFLRPFLLLAIFFIHRGKQGKIFFCLKRIA